MKQVASMATQSRNQARNHHEAGGKQSHSCHCLHMLVSCLAYSSTLKLKATCFSETSVGFQQTIRHYIPQWRILQILSWPFCGPEQFKVVLYCSFSPNNLVTDKIITNTKIWPDDSRKNTNMLYHTFIETYKTDQIPPNLLELKSN
jgi:hypothetical protein